MSAKASSTLGKPVNSVRSDTALGHHAVWRGRRIRGSVSSTRTAGRGKTTISRYRIIVHVGHEKLTDREAQPMKTTSGWLSIGQQWTASTQEGAHLRLLLAVLFCALMIPLSAFAQGAGFACRCCGSAGCPCDTPKNCPAQHPTPSPNPPPCSAEQAALQADSQAFNQDFEKS